MSRAKKNHTESGVAVIYARYSSHAQQNIYIHLKP